ncbi:ORF6N domain-containing protein [Candidatus Peribacteria bacterium]|nr:ORF6N domain-containing protein [Candidatus Peribacteria bacterium]
MTLQSSPDSIVPIETIGNRILLIRGQKVMLDRDLAELYGVSTGRLNQQVRRNSTRFPRDFMFELTLSEAKNLILQFATSSENWGGYRKGQVAGILYHFPSFP